MGKSRNNSNHKMEVEQPTKSILQKLRTTKSEIPSGSLASLLTTPCVLKRLLE